MKIPTKSGTFKYHSTIDWAKLNLSFSQSTPFHIVSMNVGSHRINKQNQNRATRGKPPQPSTNDSTSMVRHH